MTKILKEGRLNPREPWVGKKLDCRTCKCEFRLEAGDKVKFTSDQRDGDFYTASCPNEVCKADVTFTL
ncbi:MAG: hypothetical protein WCV85_04515 [Patescibacteria group bacterium]|jgi:hypothetical protein